MIPVQIRNLDSTQIARHHLHGLRFSLYRDSQFQEQWKRQFLNNQLVRHELEQLGELIREDGISVTLLKGFALLGDTYADWGARFTSDADLLVSPDEFAKLENILIENQYEVVEDKKWMGNSFKYQFLKKTDLLEFNIEVHLRLFWHSEMVDIETKPSSTLKNFYVLKHEELLLNLCGHLAFQHSFIKLFWLFDIEYYVKRYKGEIQWSRLWELAQQNSLVVSCAICLWIVDPQLFAQNPVKFSSRWQRWQFQMLQSLVNEKFLLHPTGSPIQYLLVKNLTKDYLFLNLSYWKNWLLK